MALNYRTAIAGSISLASSRRITPAALCQVVRSRAAALPLCAPAQPHRRSRPPQPAQRLSGSVAAHAPSGADLDTMAGASKRRGPAGDPLLLAKAWFFLGGASGALLFPFIPVFLQSRGLSPTEIGLISALRPWVAAPAGVLATAAADRGRLHRPLLLAGIAVSAALRASLPLWGHGAASGSGAALDKAPVAAAGGAAAAAGVGSSSSAALQLCLVLLAAEAFSFFGVLGDATVLSNLQGKQGAGASYGSQRVWASAAWGLFGALGGAGIARWGIERAPFLGFGALSLLLLCVGAAMRYNYQAAAAEPAAAAPAGEAAAADGGKQAARGAAAAAGEQGGEEAQPLLAGGAGGAAAGSARCGQQQSMAALLRQPENLIFLFQATMLGAGMGVIQTYEFVYLRQLGGSESIMGLCLLANTLAEVPAFAAQGALLARVSVSNVIDAALLTLGLRMALYATVLPAVGPWSILPMELLHGITFAAAWGACTVHAAAVAPPALSASFQGVMQACWLGAGAGLGGLAGGVLLEQAGGRGLFASGAAVMVAAAGAAAAARVVVARQGGAGGGAAGHSKAR